MTRQDAKLWMIDMRFQLLAKYRSLSELKAHFEIDEAELFNVLTSHAVLLYLDEAAVDMFEAYSAFEAEDLQAIVYGTQAEIETIAKTNQSGTSDEDLPGQLEGGATLEVGYSGNDYTGLE